MTETANKSAKGDPPLIRQVKTADLEENVDLSIEASEAERAEIVALLDIVALDSLRLDYRLRRGGGGRVHLTGRLTAQVTQTCVISLEPVSSPVDAPVDVEFWPEHLIEDLERKADDPGHSGLLDWPEAIRDDTIDLGAIVYETLATALDPYPRRAGTSFQWDEAGEPADTGESGPFAALKQLKQR